MLRLIIISTSIMSKKYNFMILLDLYNYIINIINNNINETLGCTV